MQSPWVSPPSLGSAGSCWGQRGGGRYPSLPWGRQAAAHLLKAAAGGGVCLPWAGWQGWQGVCSSPRIGKRWGGSRPGHHPPMDQDVPRHPPHPGQGAWARSLVLAEQALFLLGSVGR